jgi:hypothetical protein
MALDANARAAMAVITTMRIRFLRPSPEQLANRLLSRKLVNVVGDCP